MKNLLRLIAASAVLLTMNAQASIDFTYLGPAHADGSGQITITYPTDYTGDTRSENGIWVGQLTMQNPSSGQTFSSFCLSPAGNLSPGTASYTPLTFAQAKYGSEPPTWSMTGGIENAAYLWEMNNGSITTNAQGAALNLALWTAIYNSTAVGTAPSTGRFSVTGISPEIAAAYAADMAQLNAADPSAVEEAYSDNSGYILRPTDSSMQDLLVLPGALPADFLANANAPEPSTVFGMGFLGVMAFGGFVGERLKLSRLLKNA